MAPIAFLKLRSSVFGTLKNNQISHIFHCNVTERLVLGTHSSTNPKASMYPNKKNLDLVVKVNCSWKWIVEQKWIVIRMKFGLLLLRASLNSTLQFTFTQWLNWSCSNSLTCTWFRPKCFSEMSSKVIAICHYIQFERQQRTLPRKEPKLVPFVHSVIIVTLVVGNGSLRFESSKK